MKIGIISDTHDDIEKVQRAIESICMYLYFTDVIPLIEIR
jgi:hypothetical protein